MWLIKGFDGTWVGYPLQHGDPPRPGPPPDTFVTAYFTCPHTHQSVWFAETTITTWDASDRVECVHCDWCGETHQIPHDEAHLWFEPIAY